MILTMTNSNYFDAQLLPIPSFPIILSPMAKQQAQQLAQGCPLPRQAQIYKNALAIFAVKHYLNCLGWDVDTVSTDFQDPLRRSLLDVADMRLPGLGTIECCPIIPGCDRVRIPMESWSNRLAYIAVELDLEQHEATLLGFLHRLNISAMEQTNSEEVSLLALRGIDELVEYLVEVKPFSIDLQQWGDNLFHSGWQSIKDLLNPPQLKVAGLYRSHENALLAQRVREYLALDSDYREQQGIAGYKIITFPSESPELSQPIKQPEIALILRAIPSIENDIELSLEAIPSVNQEYLPSDLKLALLNQDRTELLMARTQDENRHLQLDFMGSMGDSVIIQLSLDNIKIEGEIYL
jgi:hypothetical protein